MLGELTPVSYQRAPAKETRKPVLQVENLTVLDDDGRVAVKNVSLEVREGEILGIAGVSGNGQKELVEALTGLRKAASGKLIVNGVDLTNRSPRRFAQTGVRHIPEDRRRTGVVEEMVTAENIMLREYREKPFSVFGVINKGAVTELAQKLVTSFGVLTPDLWDTEVRILSGGNIQRLILARELWKEPKLLIAFHPTYGLDLKAISQTHRLFMNLREKGSAILLISEDLEEIFLLSDRIAVMYNGELVGVIKSDEATVERVGKMMTGMKSSA
jgi:simple sugar transport system ATP-binding protein